MFAWLMYITRCEINSNHQSMNKMVAQPLEWFKIVSTSLIMKMSCFQVIKEWLQSVSLQAHTCVRACRGQIKQSFYTYQEVCQDIISLAAFLMSLFFSMQICITNSSQIKWLRCIGASPVITAPTLSSLHLKGI